MPEFGATLGSGERIGYVALSPWVGHLVIGNGNEWTTQVILVSEWDRLVDQVREANREMRRTYAGQ